MGNEKERIAIIKLIAEYNPYLLDVEFNTMKNETISIKISKINKDKKLLVSWHDFKKTPSSAELKKRMNQMSKFSQIL